MAAFAHTKDMNDLALRPKLLQRIVREDLPDQKRPFGNPAQLSKVISNVKTLGLLEEPAGNGTADQKLLGVWKSSVDSWIERLSILVADDMPDKCWVGICLLGITCSECSSDRFLASYSVWFQTLLKQIQLPKDSHFVTAASCDSMSDLLTRLAGFSNVKKDGTALAATVVQPVLKLLNDEQSEATWDGSIHLLCTIIKYFPSSISRHYETVEVAIASKLLSGKCRFDMLKKLSFCLGMLPKSKGDGESWSLMMQKIILRINTHLNDTFQGFEEDNISKEATRLLIQPGKDLPPPLGELVSSEDTSSTRKRSETLTTSSISALLLSCCTMLTSSFPVQVNVPVQSLMFLVERILMVNGSLPDPRRAFVTAMQQESLSSELPVLHQYSLELLDAIITCLRRKIFPHVGSIMRLFSIYFRKCVLPELRTKAYSVTKTLLISVGIGMAVDFAPDLINNVFADLSPVGFRNGGTSSSATEKPSTEVLPQSSRKKRKHGAPDEGSVGMSLDVGAVKSDTPNLISLRTAALEAVAALLAVGGGLRSEGWRSNLELLLINIAKTSLQEGWARKETNFFKANNEFSGTRANMQIAALRALLVSFQSARIRSCYIGQALKLFSEGRRETGTRLAEFCTEALLAMEVLIHPRTLQADDYAEATCFPDEVKRNAHDSDQDSLFESWLENRREPEATVSDPIDKPSETLAVTKLFDNGFEKEASAPNADSEVRNHSDTVMVDSDRLYDSLLPNDNPNRATGFDDKASERTTLDIGSSKPTSTLDIGSSKPTSTLDIKSAKPTSTLDIGSSNPTSNGLATDEEANVAKSDRGLKSFGSSVTFRVADGKGIFHADDSDLDDLPDIVLGDPDSEYEDLEFKDLD